jgi:hypothetical protein
MKKGFGVAALLLLAAAIYLLPKSKEPALAPVTPATPIASASPTRSSAVVPIVAASIAGSNSPAMLPSQNQAQRPAPAAEAGELIPDSSSRAEVPPETALHNVQRAVRQYGEMFGGNPVGTNPEITGQLSGDNPKHINFIQPQPGSTVNASGELVDAWGTPYFFHQISGSEMEIHSAGPDKLMWTSDDLVVK